MIHTDILEMPGLAIEKLGQITELQKRHINIQPVEVNNRNSKLWVYHQTGCFQINCLIECVDYAFSYVMYGVFV